MPDNIAVRHSDKPIFTLNMPDTYPAMEIPPAEDGGVMAAFRQAVGELPDEITVIKRILPEDYPQSMKTQIFVSTDGCNLNDGSYAHPLRDISAALDKLNGVGGGVIWLRGGSYTVMDTLNITSAHSGTAQSPTFISAYEDEKAVITGGIDLPPDSFTPVSGDALKRLKAEVADKIMVCDLAALGISSDKLGKITPHSRPMLFIDGKRQTIARYPNDHELVMGEVVDPGRCTSAHSALYEKNHDNPNGWTIKLSDNRSEGWQSDDIWIYGAVYAEWNKSHYPVTIDNANGTLSSRLHCPYGARWVGDNTYYFYNILEELDAPGEFYIDTKNQKLYLYPDCMPTEITLVTLSAPVIRIDGAKNVILNGVTVTGTMANGVDINNGEYNIVEGCNLTANGGSGVCVEKSIYSGVIYSAFSRNCEAQCVLASSDRANLVPDHNFIQNCQFRDPVTQTGTFTGGVGYIVSHNLYDGTVAFVYDSNECVFEYNDFNKGSVTTTDSGMIYVNGHDLSSRGNHIRYNYFHNVRASHAGVYIDDCASGQYVYGNIVDFDNAESTQAFGGKMTYRLHNGRECVFYNNISINATSSAFSDNANYYNPSSIRWSPMRESVLSRGRDKIASKVFCARYPIYADFYKKMVQHAKDVLADGYTRNSLEESLREPAYNVYENNIIIKAKVAFNISEAGMRTAVGIERNLVSDVSPLDEYYQLNPDRQNELPNFKNVPFDRMGLCERDDLT